MRLPPGPRKPSVLQLLDWVRRPVEFMEDCSRRFGDSFTVRFPGIGGPIVFVTKPEVIRQIFTADTDVLFAGKANQILAPLVGASSILLLDRSEHLTRRKLLLPPYHGERMQNYATSMREITQASIARWPVGTPFSLHHFMQQITLEVILRTVFGFQAGPELDRFSAIVTELFHPPPAMFAFMTLFMNPEKLNIPFSPYRKFSRDRDAVDRELYKMIERRRRSGSTGDGSDILSMLLDARDENGQALSDQELRDELMTAIAAGHETTATSLSWIFDRILSTPGVSERIDDELRASGPSFSPKQLPYLDAVVKETLRLRPIFPMIIRRVESPIEIGGVSMPVGSYVAPCVYLAHRRPEAYPEPERFMPERFLGKKIDPYSWLPFGGGVRRCLGMAFAEYEMAIVLATVLSQVKLSLAEGPAKIERRSITLAPSGGTRVIMNRRADQLRAAS